MLQPACCLCFYCGAVTRRGKTREEEEREANPTETERFLPPSTARVPVLSVDGFREQLSYLLFHIEMRQAQSQNCNSGVKCSKEALYVLHIISGDFVLFRD